MDLSDSILDQAFAVFEEFGPDRRMDRKERLRAVFSQLSPEEAELLLQRMQEVSRTVWSLAEQGGEAKLGEAKVTEMLKEKHPFLVSKGLAHARYMVNYYAWHEGYDK